MEAEARLLNAQASHEMHIKKLHIAQKKLDIKKLVLDKKYPGCHSYVLNQPDSDWNVTFNMIYNAISKNSNEKEEQLYYNFQCPPVNEETKEYDTRKYPSVWQPYFKIYNHNSIPLISNILTSNGFLPTGLHNWSLMWNGSNFPDSVYSNLCEYQRVNHFPGSCELTRKDRLCVNMDMMKSLYGRKDFHFLPKTYIFPEQHDEFIEEHQESQGEQLWIVKPTSSSRGRGIYIIKDLETMNLENETCIVQEYISNPFLIHGIKFDMRIYVLVTSFDPLKIYIYHNGLVRFACLPFSTKDLSRHRHLTNYSVNKSENHYVFNKDTAYQNRGHKWDFHGLNSFFKRMGINEEETWAKVYDVIIKSILSVEHIVCHQSQQTVSYPHKNCFEIFGFDILLDEKMDPWVLEINLSPSLSVETPLDLQIKSQLVAETFDLLHIPLHTTCMLNESKMLSRERVVKRGGPRKSDIRHGVIRNPFWRKGEEVGERYETGEREEGDKEDVEERVEPEEIEEVAEEKERVALGLEKDERDKFLKKVSGWSKKRKRLVKETLLEFSKAKGWIRIFPNRVTAHRYKYYLSDRSKHTLWLLNNLFPPLKTVSLLPLYYRSDRAALGLSQNGTKVLKDDNASKAENGAVSKCEEGISDLNKSTDASTEIRGEKKERERQQQLDAHLVLLVFLLVEYLERMRTCICNIHSLDPLQKKKTTGGNGNKKKTKRTYVFGSSANPLSPTCQKMDSSPDLLQHFNLQATSVFLQHVHHLYSILSLSQSKTTAITSMNNNEVRSEQEETGGEEAKEKKDLMERMVEYLESKGKATLEEIHKERGDEISIFDGFRKMNYINNCVLENLMHQGKTQQEFGSKGNDYTKLEKTLRENFNVKEWSQLAIFDTHNASISPLPVSLLSREMERHEKSVKITPQVLSSCLPHNIKNIPPVLSLLSHLSPATLQQIEHSIAIIILTIVSQPVETFFSIFERSVFGSDAKIVLLYIIEFLMLRTLELFYPRLQVDPSHQILQNFLLYFRQIFQMQKSFLLANDRHNSFPATPSPPVSSGSGEQIPVPPPIEKETELSTTQKKLSYPSSPLQIITLPPRRESEARPVNTLPSPLSLSTLSPRDTPTIIEKRETDISPFSIYPSANKLRTSEASNSTATGGRDTASSSGLQRSSEYSPPLSATFPVSYFPLSPSSPYPGPIPLVSNPSFPSTLPYHAPLLATTASLPPSSLLAHAVPIMAPSKDSRGLPIVSHMYPGAAFPQTGAQGGMFVPLQRPPQSVAPMVEKESGVVRAPTSAEDNSRQEKVSQTRTSIFESFQNMFFG